MGDDLLERFLPHWRVWPVRCGAGTGDWRNQWSAHPHPELQCGTQPELVAAISAAAGSNPTLALLTRAAGPAVIPGDPFAPIPARPALTQLDQERGKLAALHPAWHVWYGIRQLSPGRLRITWHARPEPTITGADSAADLATRINQVMSDAYVKVCEAGRASRKRP
jgi:hypothetical protein